MSGQQARIISVEWIGQGDLQNRRVTHEDCDESMTNRLIAYGDLEGYVDRNGDSMRLWGGRGAISVGLLAASEDSVEFWGSVRDSVGLQGFVCGSVQKAGSFGGIRADLLISQGAGLIQAIP